MAASSAWQPAYLQRSFGWGIREVGSVLGALHLVGGIAGMLGSGALADWLQARGHGDAHLRIYVFAMPAIVIAALAAYASETPWIALSGIAMISVMAPFIAVAASGLALGTPPERRGIASGAFLFVYNIVGFGAGPTVAAWLASQMPAPGDLGAALTLMFIVVSPVATALFLAGLRPMRGAVAAVRAPLAHQATPRTNSDAAVTGGGNDPCVQCCSSRSASLWRSRRSPTPSHAKGRSLCGFHAAVCAEPTCMPPAAMACRCRPIASLATNTLARWSRSARA